jgi:hypothetical protein
LFLVVSFVFFPQSKAVFWCNPCVGKVDTASFWPIPWWKCGTPVTETHTYTYTDRGKRRQNETQENQRFSKERAG